MPTDDTRTPDPRAEHCSGCSGWVATYSGQGEGYECSGVAARPAPDTVYETYVANDGEVSIRARPSPDTGLREALLDELSESPLPGARYARDVVKRRLPGILLATRPDTGPLDIDTFVAGIDSPWHSPESRKAWIALFFRDMQVAARATRTVVATGANAGHIPLDAIVRLEDLHAD